MNKEKIASRTLVIFVVLLMGMVAVPLLHLYQLELLALKTQDVTVTVLLSAIQ